MKTPVFGTPTFFTFPGVWVYLLHSNLEWHSAPLKPHEWPYRVHHDVTAFYREKCPQESQIHSNQHSWNEARKWRCSKRHTHTLTVLNHQVPLGTAGVIIQLHPINVTQQNEDHTSRNGDIVLSHGCVLGSFPFAVKFKCDFVQLYLYFSNFSYIWFIFFFTPEASLSEHTHTDGERNVVTILVRGRLQISPVLL